MHELLAPVLWVVEHDAIEKRSLQAPSFTASPNDQIMLQVLDSDYVEHDSFTIFYAIMQNAKAFYEHNEEEMFGGAQSVSPIVARSQRIHQVLLGAVDPELADHLFASDVLPQIFLT